MTDIAPKPPWAPSVWKNSRGELFAQFEDGHVLRFSLLESGLSKLLKLIPAIEAQPGYISGRSNFEQVTRGKRIKIARKTAERRELVKTTEAQRRAADDIAKMMRKK